MMLTVVGLEPYSAEKEFVCSLNSSRASIEGVIATAPPTGLRLWTPSNKYMLEYSRCPLAVMVTAFCPVLK